MTILIKMCLIHNVSWNPSFGRQITRLRLTRNIYMSVCCLCKKIKRKNQRNPVKLEIQTKNRYMLIYIVIAIRFWTWHVTNPPSISFECLNSNCSTKLILLLPYLRYPRDRRSFSFFFKYLLTHTQRNKVVSCQWLLHQPQTNRRKQKYAFIC